MRSGDSVKTYLDAVDAQTGEQVRFVAQRVTVDRTAGGFFMGYQEAIQQIARSEALTDGDRVVFLELLGRLDFNNYVLINVSDIAKDMNRNRVGVSRSIKRLTENGILHRGPKEGQNYSYILDPWTAWRGKVEEKSRVQREVSERKWKVLDGGSKDGKKKS